MSNRALNWAFESGLPSGPRFVLVILADHAGDHSGEDWACYPALKRIVDMSGMSRSSVERHLSFLRREGWISTTPRRRADGGIGVNDFILHRCEERRAALKSARSGGDEDALPPLNLRGGVSPNVRGGSPQIEGDPPPTVGGEEPLGEPSDEPASRAREPGSAGFDTAIAHWPDSGRKRTRWDAARAAWALACSIEDPRRLMAAVLACAADPDLAKGDYGWPAFDRWLSEERWRAWLPASSPSAQPAAMPRTAFVGPAEIRAAVVRAQGEEFAGAYLDRAGWDAEARTIAPATSVAFDRLRDVRGVLAEHGASLAPPAVSRGN